jgi:ABC-type Fe3+/spermidine/putrescine transport system ATPase subunit
MSGGAVRLVDLTEHYGHVVAVDPIDLEVEEGEFGCVRTVILLSPPGSP